MANTPPGTGTLKQKGRGKTRPPGKPSKPVSQKELHDDVDNLEAQLRGLEGYDQNLQREVNAQGSALNSLGGDLGNAGSGANGSTTPSNTSGGILSSVTSHLTLTTVLLGTALGVGAWYVWRRRKGAAPRRVAR